MTNITNQSKTKGILLAGGKGTRLYPLTLGISKQLLPIYDKPMIYYPLSVLMLAGIREILIISTPRDIPILKNVLGDGSQWGVSLKYAIQENPNGLPEALIIAEEFLDGSPCCLILGDNFFYGDTLPQKLKEAQQKNVGATLFAYRVQNPTKYGVVNFDCDNHPIELEEKPIYPKSNYAVTGLYFYENEAVALAKTLKPSSRGETEITDLNQLYLDSKRLKVSFLGRGMAWLDAGSPKTLLEASEFVCSIEERQGLKIACLEEIAYRQNWIDEHQLRENSTKYQSSDYGTYLLGVTNERVM